MSDNQISTRLTLAKLYDLGCSFKEFERTDDGSMTEWTIEPFRFHYHRHSTGEEWQVWISHPDGNELRIVHESFGTSSHSPPWAFTTAGAWDSALQEALLQIHVTCKKESLRRKEIFDKAEKDQAQINARKKAKFEAMFTKEPSPCPTP